MYLQSLSQGLAEVRSSSIRSPGSPWEAAMGDGVTLAEGWGGSCGEGRVDEDAGGGDNKESGAGRSGEEQAGGRDEGAGAGTF